MKNFYKPSIALPFNNQFLKAKTIENIRVQGKINNKRTLKFKDYLYHINKQFYRIFSPFRKGINLLGATHLFYIKKLRAILFLFFTTSILMGNAQVSNNTKSLHGCIHPMLINGELPECFWDITLTGSSVEGDKKKITLSDFRDKFIVLDFWATYCVPCIESLDKWNKWQKIFKDDIVVLPIAVFNRNDKVLRFAKDRGWDLNLIYGNQQDTILNNMFYYFRSFGQVWIKDNKLFAIPNSPNLTLNHVYDALNGIRPPTSNYKYTYQEIVNRREDSND